MALIIERCIMTHSAFHIKTLQGCAAVRQQGELQLTQQDQWM